MARSGHNRKTPTTPKDRYLSGKRIRPRGLTGRESLRTVIDETFLAYNAARLREACHLVTEKMLEANVTVGLSLAGALTPAGLGCSAIVPLIKAGFVDWIVATGANLYHDLHFAFNLPLHTGSHRVDDAALRRHEVVRIYDVLLDFDCLVRTDEILKGILAGPAFQKEMSTAELHHLLGKHAADHEQTNGLKDVSMLAAAYRCGVPVHTSSPGDSSVGLNAALLRLRGNRLRIDPSLDVNETAAYVFAAKRRGGASAVILIGGGSPKNFVLQTEPHLQDILNVPDGGHDYFLQVTDARPDTGGLSGATPQEAVSWGKVDPARLPDAVVCYCDATIALPILTHYALAAHKKRQARRLYDRRRELVAAMKREAALPEA